MKKISAVILKTEELLAGAMLQFWCSGPQWPEQLECR